MSTQLEQLKNSIREILSEIEKEEEDKLKKETTVTGNVAGYDTPRAFSNNGQHKSGYTKKMASLTGYSAVNENRFQKLRLDQTMTPNQKIGLGIREIRRKVDEIEKFLEWYGKIKKENAMKGENFWKRTNHHIYRIKERLSNIGKNVTTLRK
jgi:hypothetical protein